jgi:hypothetical protein
MKFPSQIKFFSFQKTKVDNENLYYVVEAEYVKGNLSKLDRQGPYYMFEAERILQSKIQKYKAELYKDVYVQDDITL